MIEMGGGKSREGRLQEVRLNKNRTERSPSNQLSPSWQSHLSVSTSVNFNPSFWARQALSEQDAIHS